MPKTKLIKLNYVFNGDVSTATFKNVKELKKSIAEFKRDSNPRYVRIGNAIERAAKSVNLIGKGAKAAASKKPAAPKKPAAKATAKKVTPKKTTAPSKVKEGKKEGKSVPKMSAKPGKISGAAKKQSGKGSSGGAG